MFKVVPQSRGEFIPDYFFIGSNTKNKYVPIYALSEIGHFLSHCHASEDGEIISFLHFDSENFIYYKPAKTDFVVSDIGTYDNLFSALTSNLTPGTFNFKFDDNEHEIIALKGYIQDVYGNPLLVLSSCTKEVFLEPLHEDIPDYNKLKLFVSTEFITNPIYKNVYRKLYNNYIEEAITKTVRVEYCSSEEIIEELYKNDLSIDFNSITELKAHLNSGIGNMLFEDIEEYAEHQRRGWILTNPVDSQGIEEIIEFEEEQVPLEWTPRGNAGQGIFHQINNLPRMTPRDTVEMFREHVINSRTSFIDSVSNVEYIASIDPVTNTPTLNTRTVSEDDVDIPF